VDDEIPKFLVNTSGVPNFTLLFKSPPDTGQYHLQNASASGARGPWPGGQSTRGFCELSRWIYTCSIGGPPGDVSTRASGQGRLADGRSGANHLPADEAKRA